MSLKPVCDVIAYDGSARPSGSNADEWQLFLVEHITALPFLAVQIAEAIEALEKQVYVPGMRRCQKCKFTLMSNFMCASTGRLAPNDKSDICPNGCGTLWRVSEREVGNDMVDRAEEFLKRAVDAETKLATPVVFTTNTDPAFRCEVAGPAHIIVAPVT